MSSRRRRAPLPPPQEVLDDVEALRAMDDRELGDAIDARFRAVEGEVARQHGEEANEAHLLDAYERDAPLVRAQDELRRRTSA